MTEDKTINQDDNSKIMPVHSRDMVLGMGPAHPVTHGTVRFVVVLEGETIKEIDVEVGYLHRGFEKMCESMGWEMLFPYTDRLNYVSPMINNVGYALAVEKLIGIEVPERCQFIRVIVSELSRICDHFTNVGAAAMELGAATAFLYFVEARDLIWDILEEICGSRLTSNYVRIGGLKNDLPENFAERIRHAFSEGRRFRDEIDKLLTKNRIFIDRFRNVGIMPKDDAIAYGFTGVMLRASGVPYDVRKAQPYLVYDQMNFEVPVGAIGDNFDRYLIRMEELLQSMSIVEQAIKKMPSGPINISNPDYRRESKDDIYSKMESLIYHFKKTSNGIALPKGEIYFPVEGGNGEVGFYIASDGSEKPLRFHVRAPSFIMTAAMPKMCVGGMIADIVPTFDMLNMIGGECDR